jgi:hypothetical protein
LQGHRYVKPEGECVGAKDTVKLRLGIASTGCVHTQRTVNADTKECTILRTQVQLRRGTAGGGGSSRRRSKRVDGDDRFGLAVKLITVHEEGEDGTAINLLDNHLS